MNTFSFTGAKKIVFGRGSFASLPEQMAELKISRPLIVLDRSLAENGFLEKVTGLLGSKCVIFDKTEPEPRIELADEGAKLALKGKCDCVIGIGGGSAMDLAKAIAVLAANKGKADDYLGLNKVPGPGLPKIMVPTTAGTGSEVTFTAVFIRKNLKKKEGMNSPYLYPEMALLDPELTLTPAAQADGRHGNRRPVPCHRILHVRQCLAHERDDFPGGDPADFRQPADLRSQRSEHRGARSDAPRQPLCGMGLANAGVTAVHSLSYPLGGKYGVSHGLANTIMLPPVMAFNLPGASGEVCRYRRGDGRSRRQPAPDGKRPIWRWRRWRR